MEGAQHAVHDEDDGSAMDEDVDQANHVEMFPMLHGLDLPPYSHSQSLLSSPHGDFLQRNLPARELLLGSVYLPEAPPSQPLMHHELVHDLAWGKEVVSRRREQEMSRRREQEVSRRREGLRR
eukprot:749696-Hanusia_phi.AAC.1